VALNYLPHLTNHLHLNADVNNAWSYTSTPLIIFHDVVPN